MDQVNSRRFISATSTQALILNRISTNKQPALRLMDILTERKKNLKIQHTLIDRKANTSEDQLGTHGLAFSGRLLSATMTLPNRGSIFTCVT